LQHVPVVFFHVGLGAARVPIARRLFGDNYLSPLATIKNPHLEACKTLRCGGLVKRSEP
jgi:hypothetical protein